MWCMTGLWRAWWLGLGVVGGVAAVGLLVWVTTAHPEGSAQAWGVAGSVASVAALAVAVWQLRNSAHGPVVPVQADGGSNAAGGSMNNPSARDTRPGSGPPPAQVPGVSASGGSNAAGGDMNDPTAYRGP